MRRLSVFTPPICGRRGHCYQGARNLTQTRLGVRCEKQVTILVLSSLSLEMKYDYYEVWVLNCVLDGRGDIYITISLYRFFLSLSRSLSSTRQQSSVPPLVSNHQWQAMNAFSCGRTQDVVGRTFL